MSRKTTPYDPAKAGIDAALGAGRSIFADAVGHQYFPGQQVVPFAPQTTQGIGALGNAAGSANPVVRSAAAANTGIANGTNKFLSGIGGNSGDAAYNVGARRLGDQIQSQFAGAGMSGSERHGRAFAQGIGDYTAQFGLGRYDMDQRNRLSAAGLQMGAANQAAGIAQAQAIPAQHLLQAGGIQENRGQRVIDAEKQRHMFNINRPLDAYMRYLQPTTGVGMAFGEQTGTNAGTARQQRVGLDISHMFAPGAGGGGGAPTPNQFRNYGSHWG